MTETIVWKGKPIDECSREELIECINEVWNMKADMARSWDRIEIEKLETENKLMRDLLKK